MNEMKTLTVNDVQYEIVDDVARTDILRINGELETITGYGLGENTAEAEDLNDETKCGWKAFTRSCANIPFDYGVVMTMNRYGSQITQIAFNPFMAGKGEICIRHQYENTWYPWEYLNPPMLTGVEYRTTERYNGKPVYRKMISYTNAENIGSKSGVANISVPHNISGFGELVRVTGRQNGNMLPYITSTGGIASVSSVTSVNVIIDMLNSEWTSREWTFDIAYTKTS